jgi:hypothetical protein
VGGTEDNICSDMFFKHQAKQEIKQIMIKQSSNAGHGYELRLEEFLHGGVRSGRSADGVGEGKCGENYL